jgi:hypothetical protein
MKRILWVLGIVALLLTNAAISDGSTCTGSDPCNACKNCKYCKHCAKAGGKCGVCKRNAALDLRRLAKAGDTSLPGKVDGF